MPAKNESMSTTYTLRRVFCFITLFTCVSITVIWCVYVLNFYQFKFIYNEQEQESLMMYNDNEENTPSLPFINGSSNVTLLLGRVNYDEWLCGPFVGYHVDDLRLHHHQWPNHPTKRQSSRLIRVAYDKGLQHVGAKLYGYILPPISGNYKFIIRQLKSTAAVSGEFWISTDLNPMNIRKLTELNKSNKPSAESKPQSTNFQKGKQYYFEFHVKAFKGKVNIFVEWKLPQNSYFQPIPSSLLSMAVEVYNSAYSKSKTFSSIIEALQSNILPSNELQSTSYAKFKSTYNYSKVTNLNILPKCNFTASYVSVSIVPKYTGINKVFDSTIYSPDSPYEKLLTPVPQSTVNEVLKLYTDQFHKIKSTNKNLEKVLNISHLEETQNKNLGSRFLLEMNVKLKEKTICTSEYVYLPRGGKELCHISNFQPKRDVHVTIVVSIKNLGGWVDHLIHNIEDIYNLTKDENFELVISDFESDDRDIKKLLMKSSIPKWKYIPLKGMFYKTKAINKGIDYVKDLNSIVMTIDMHLTLPPDFIDTARKHTIQGKMAYAPVFYRLREGVTENDPIGFWESLGYGLFSMYKSDWISVGKMNEVKYKYKWGGEDYDLVDRVVAKGYEIYRLRPPGLFHYHHSKEGMWTNKGKTKC